MKNQVILNWIGMLIVLTGVIAWSEYRIREEAARAVAEQEKKDIEFWKTRLVPLYREMGVLHNDNPATKDELFAPLLKSLEPVWVGCAPPERAQLAEDLREVRVEWTDDGAGGCWPEILDQARVKAALREPDIWPSLIALLDSVAPTKSTFSGQAVPLGYVSLDILLKLVREEHRERVFSGFADDGLWANVRGGYYFPPDVLELDQGRKKMRRVRESWESLYTETDGGLFALPERDTASE